METQYLGPPKIKDIEDSSSEQEGEKQTRSNQKRVDSSWTEEQENFMKNMLKTICSNRNVHIGKRLMMFPCQFVATIPTHSRSYTYDVITDIVD